MYFTPFVCIFSFFELWRLPWHLLCTFLEGALFGIISSVVRWLINNAYHRTLHCQVRPIVVCAATQAGVFVVCARAGMVCLNCQPSRRGRCSNLGQSAIGIVGVSIGASQNRDTFTRNLVHASFKLEMICTVAN